MRSIRNLAAMVDEDEVEMDSGSAGNARQALEEARQDTGGHPVGMRRGMVFERAKHQTQYWSKRLSRGRKLFGLGGLLVRAKRR